MHQSISSRIFGFLLSLLLTAAALWIIAFPQTFGFKAQKAILFILILASLQATVQSIFFLDLLQEKGPRWNFIVFASTIGIIFIIIFFSIWIMDTLNYNMMMSLL